MFLECSERYYGKTVKSVSGCITYTDNENRREELKLGKKRLLLMIKLCLTLKIL
jgi:hypothetical protein